VKGTGKLLNSKIARLAPGDLTLIIKICFTCFYVYTSAERVGALSAINIIYSNAFLIILPEKSRYPSQKAHAGTPMYVQVRKFTGRV
jgi:hypothetical protein